MTYSVLLYGVTTELGRKIARCLTQRAKSFARVAVLTLFVVTDKESDHKLEAASAGLETVVGHPIEPTSYNGFDIAVFAVEDRLCAAQIEYFNAAFAGGVKHIIPAECKDLSSTALCVPVPI
jgi:hypothetical protein